MTYHEPEPKVTVRKFERVGTGFLVVTRYEGGPAEGETLSAELFEERWGRAMRRLVETQGVVVIRP